MIPTQYENILKQLLEKTLAGKANWKATSSEDTFLISFKTFSLKIWRFSNPYDESNGISFGVYNDKGKKIDDFSVESGKQLELANSLFENARRKAFNVEDALKLMSLELQADTVGDEPEQEESPF